jgi:hypothetical protein
VEELGAELAGGAEPALADIAFTLAAEVRPPRDCDATLAVVAASLDDLRGKLDKARTLLAGDGDARACAVTACTGPSMADGRGPGRVPVPGQAHRRSTWGARSPWPSRGARLLRARRPGAGRTATTGRSSRFIFPPPSFTPEQLQSRQAEAHRDETSRRRALGATDLAYLHVLRALGVEPEMVAGHS